MRATGAERSRPLPGDGLIVAPIAALNHAITIRAEPAAVWPWLAQMGAGRAGWYSYDLIDNGGKRSADRIVPELQKLAIGMVFPALPGATDGFTLASFEADRSLVIGWKAPGGGWLMTWAFVLEPSPDGGSTRLLVRARGGTGYTFQGLPWGLTRRIVPAVHFVMQRRQLWGIATRAEIYDALLDAVMPVYDVVERHAIGVAAPPRLTLAAACEANLDASLVIRAIFRAREIVLGSKPQEAVRPRGLLALTTSIGWRVLKEVPDREVLVGAVTQPWLAAPVFRSIPAGEFEQFAEPGYVKIAWTLQADPVDETHAIFHTETRVCTTDAAARDRFRNYWSYVAPGVALIRLALLRPLKHEAERRFRVERGLEIAEVPDVTIRTAAR